MNTTDNTFKVNVISPVQTLFNRESGEIRGKYFNVFLISTISKKKMYHRIDQERQPGIFEEIYTKTKNWKVYPQTIRNYRLQGMIITTTHYYSI